MKTTKEIDQEEQGKQWVNEPPGLFVSQLHVHLLAWRVLGKA